MEADDKKQGLKEPEFYTLEIRSTHFPPMYFNERLELTFLNDEQVAFTEGGRCFANLDNIKDKIAENIRFRKWKYPPMESRTFREVEFTLNYAKADMSKFTREYYNSRDGRYSLMCQPMSRRQKIEAKRGIIADYQSEIYDALDSADYFEEQIKIVENEIKELEAIENNK